MGNLNMNCCPSTQYDINRCGLPIYHVTIPNDRCCCNRYNGFGVNPDWNRIYYHNCYIDNMYGNHCCISGINFSKDSVTNVIVGNIGFIIAQLTPCDADNDCVWEYDKSILKEINSKGNTFTFIAISVEKYGETTTTTITCRSKKNPNVFNTIDVNVYDYVKDISIAFQKPFNYINYHKHLEFTPILNLISGTDLINDGQDVMSVQLTTDDGAVLSKGKNGVYLLYNDNNSDSNTSATVMITSKFNGQNGDKQFKYYTFELRNEANSEEIDDDVYLTNAKYDTNTHQTTYNMSNGVSYNTSLANEFEFYKK